MAAAVGDLAWLRAEIERIPHAKLQLKVSEWAAKYRKLPAELTSHPGPWDNSYTPYLVEIMDHLSASSPTNQVAVMKAHQVGATVGLGENWMGYTIGHDPGSMMFLSAEADIAQTTVELRLDRMIKFAGLEHKIAAHDTKSKRTGDTASKKEFANGYLIVAGARNPNKLRNYSIKKLYCNEVDAWPLEVGNAGQKEGRPIDIAFKRTSAFERNRKILYESTPLVTQTSEIYRLFLRGDQRRYFVPCPHCEHMQWLRWEGTAKDGRKYGVTFAFHEDGRLDEDSVGWVCKSCFKVFFNHDKAWMLPRGEWRPTAVAQESGFVSYHIPASISPVGMHSWTAMVYEWLKAWDQELGRPKDAIALKSFYNLELGVPFEERGESPRYERVIAHRRSGYVEGQVPNEMAIAETGGPVVVVTLAADVHGHRIDYEVVGWCEGRQSYSIQWGHCEGETDQLEAPDGAWSQLRKVINEGKWTADDGRQYMIQISVIDAGYRPAEVHEFCGEFSGGVFPVMGRDLPRKGSQFKEHSEYESQHGVPGFNITTTIYKDRFAAWLKTDWYEGERQPEGYPNYPDDRRDDFFKQYQSEEKRERKNKLTGQRESFFWTQVGQRPNHAWDCRGYGMAALDLLCLDYCRDIYDPPRIDYDAFWQGVAPQHNDGVSDFSWHPDQKEA